MSKTLLITMVVVFVIAVAGSFYAGTVYGQRQATANLAAQFPAFNRNVDPENLPQFPGGRLGGPGEEGMAVQRGQGGGRFGQIAGIDGDTVLLTGRDGNEVKILITDTTLIEKYASVSASELQTGETVIVSGSQNEDGSITARSLQVAPAGRLGGVGRGATDGGQ